MQKRSILHVRAESTEDRIIRFVASSAGVARDGGIVEPRGWDTQSYERNPQFLWAHDASQLPIGKGVRIEKTEDALLIDVEFAGEAEGHALAETVFRLYKSGFMNSVSVGFRVVEEREPTEAERDAGAHWVASKAELLELSAVPIPADPSAVSTARAKAAVREGVLTRSETNIIRSWSAIERWASIADLLETEMRREEEKPKDEIEEPKPEVIEEEAPVEDEPKPEDEEEVDITAALRDLLGKALEMLAEDEEEEEVEEEKAEGDEEPEPAPEPTPEEEEEEVVEMAYALVNLIRKLTVAAGGEKPVAPKAGASVRENADADTDPAMSSLLADIETLYN